MNTPPQGPGVGRAPASPATTDQQLDLLVSAASELLGPGQYAGTSWRDLYRFDEFTQAVGTPAELRFNSVDMTAMQAYAALAVWTRAVIADGSSTTINGIAANVAALERTLYGSQAFPYGEDAAKSGVLDAAFPDSAALMADPLEALIRLSSDSLRHEWTVKPGKRLYEALVLRLPAAARRVICEPNGLLTRYESRKDAVEIAKELSLLFVAALGHEVLLLPLCVTAAVIMVHRGLESFCEKHRAQGEASAEGGEESG